MKLTDLFPQLRIAYSFVISMFKDSFFTADILGKVGSKSISINSSILFKRRVFTYRNHIAKRKSFEFFMHLNLIIRKLFITYSIK